MKKDFSLFLKVILTIDEENATYMQKVCQKHKTKQKTTNIKNHNQEYFPKIKDLKLQVT